MDESWTWVLMSGPLQSKAERQLAAVKSDLERLVGTDSTLAAGILNEAAAGLATAMLTLRNLEEAVNRETVMDKRQAAKQ